MLHPFDMPPILWQLPTINCRVFGLEVIVSILRATSIFASDFYPRPSVHLRLQCPVFSLRSLYCNVSLSTISARNFSRPELLFNFRVFRVMWSFKTHYAMLAAGDGPGGDAPVGTQQGLRRAAGEGNLGRSRFADGQEGRGFADEVFEASQFIGTGTPFGAGLEGLQFRGGGKITGE